MPAQACWCSTERTAGLACRYVGLDLRAELAGAGFGTVLQGSNTPTHMTVVARKG